MFTSVNGHIVNANREELWEDIGAIRALWRDPWCLGGGGGGGGGGISIP